MPRLSRPIWTRWCIGWPLAGAIALGLTGAALADDGSGSGTGSGAAHGPRPSLLPLAQPLWSELKPAQHEVLAPLEPQWNALPATKKRSWLKLADQVPRMKPPEREKALARIREWAELTPEQRRLARNNYRLAKGLDKDEREASWEQYSSMTPEQRAVLRTNGWTSNTAARHAGAPTGLAKEAARPLPGAVLPTANQRKPAANNGKAK